MNGMAQGFVETMMTTPEWETKNSVFQLIKNTSSPTEKAQIQKIDFISFRHQL